MGGLVLCYIYPNWIRQDYKIYTYGHVHWDASPKLAHDHQIGDKLIANQVINMGQKLINTDSHCLSINH